MEENIKNQIEKLCKESAEKGIFSACVIGVLDSNQKEAIIPFGKYPVISDFEDLDNNGEFKATNKNSVFDVASVSKSIPVASIALKLILEGKLSPDDKIKKFLPNFRTPFAEQACIKHLLSHTLDYRFSLASYKDHKYQDIIEKLYTHEFEKAPGDLFVYCNSSSLVLGLVLEKLTGKKLPALAQKLFFIPLQMDFTSYAPKEIHSLDNIVPTEYCSWRDRIICGEVHDESAYAMREYGTVGSAGLFSTVPDIMKFVKMLLNDGKAYDQEIIPNGILDLASNNATPNLDTKAALGWELAQTRFMGSDESSVNSRIGKTGFTGSSVVIDVKSKEALVILSNFTWPKREANADRINQFRRNIADIVFS